MADVITPFEQASDVDVVMTVVRPQAKVGLGNLLILNPVDSYKATGDDTITNQDTLNGLLLRKTDTASGAKYREYKNLDAVTVDYAENSPVWIKASAYFAQENHSDRVAVLDYDPTKVMDSLKAFWFFNWTFAVIVKNPDKDGIAMLSNIFEANKDKFLVLMDSTTETFTPLQGQTHTIAIYHTGTQAIDSALIGNTASLPVGSTTWKFRNLTGIDPDILTSQELAGLNNASIIGYMQVAGANETTEGKTLSGEYIDTLHGVLWVQNEMQSKLEKLLQSNNKIPYEQSGINTILSVATGVLESAWEQGIILTNETKGVGDYSITATPRSEQSAEDLSNRHFGGLSFTYHASGAIHTITVHGTVNSDTLVNA